MPREGGGDNECNIVENTNKDLKDESVHKVTLVVSDCGPPLCDAIGNKNLRGYRSRCMTH